MKIFRYIKLYKFFLVFLSTAWVTLWCFLSFWLRLFIGIHVDIFFAKQWGRNCLSEYGIKLHLNDNVGKPVGIYVAPHTTFWDIVILASQLDGFFVSKAEVKKWPLVGIGARMVRTVFIEREKGMSALKSMVIKGKKLLDLGSSLMVFPEGTRMPVHMAEFKAGPFFVSFETGYPIIPVIIYYKPSEPFILKTKQNFVKEIYIQALAFNKPEAYMEIMKPVSPTGFKSANELRIFVQDLMQKRFDEIKSEAIFSA
jgi:1-acyl-sn-glycerol-3-phosphate acyltransferase